MPPGRPVRDQFRELRPLLAAIYLPVLTGIAVLVAVELVADVPLRKFFIDPVAEFNAPAYIGLMSNFGVVLWAFTAAVGLFGGWVLSGHSQSRKQAWFLGGAGLVSALLLFDDLYLLHEEIIPERLLIPQPVVLAVYGLVVLGFLYRFRDSILVSDYALLLLAGVFFAGSVLIDVLVSNEEFSIFGVVSGRHLIEDGLKLLGIVAWSAYFWRVAHQAVVAALRVGAPQWE